MIRALQTPPVIDEDSGSKYMDYREFQNDLVDNIDGSDKANIPISNIVVTELLDSIKKEREKANDKFFILSVAYDRVFKKYNWISLTILVLSACVTFTEAVKLSVIELVRSKNYDADIDVIGFIMNITTLSIGTIITVLSSIIRFKNYRETLEKLKDKENILITYRDKYKRKYEKLLNLIMLDMVSEADIKEINDKIAEYNNQVETINVFEYLRIKDILRYNRFKAQFDIEMRKIELDRRISMKNFEENAGLEIPNDGNLSKLMNIEKIKRKLLGKNSQIIKVDSIEY